MSFCSNNIEPEVLRASRSKAHRPSSSRADSLFLAVQSACDVAQLFERLMSRRFPGDSNNNDDDDEWSRAGTSVSGGSVRSFMSEELFMDDDDSLAFELEHLREESTLKAELAKAELEWTHLSRQSGLDMEEFMMEAVSVVESMTVSSCNDDDDTTNCSYFSGVSSTPTEEFPTNNEDLRNEQLRQLTLPTSRKSLTSRIWSIMSKRVSTTGRAKSDESFASLVPSSPPDEHNDGNETDIDIFSPLLTITLLCAAKAIYSASQQGQACR